MTPVPPAHPKPETCQDCYFAVRNYHSPPDPDKDNSYAPYVCKLTGRKVLRTMTACLLFRPRRTFPPPT